MGKNNVIEFDNIEDFNKEFSKMRITKGNPKNLKKVHKNRKGCIKKEGVLIPQSQKEGYIHLDKNANPLYPEKPDWAEAHFTTLTTKELKEVLLEVADQTTFDIVNHILIDRENE